VAKKSLERLLKLELIEERRGRLYRTHIRYQTSEDVANSAIKKFHNNALEKAQEALREIPVELRDFSALILKAHKKDLKYVKNKIREFQDELAAELESKNTTDVYQFSIQFFPLSKNESETRSNI